MEIHVDGVFDPSAARSIAARIAVVPAGAFLVVDFTKVVEFQDSAAAPLAQALADRTVVTVRGLGRHHLRVLRYLGTRFVEVTRPGSEPSDG
jgi:hypothetical protein